MKTSIARFTLLIALTALVAFGCSSDDPAAPANDTGEPAPFYPLTVGNHWTYQRTASLQIIMLGDPTPEPPEVRQATGERTLVGIETFDGIDYVVEEELLYAEGFPDTLTWQVLLRQDDGGLYEAGFPVEEDPPASLSPAREYPPTIEQALRDLGERARQLSRVVDGRLLASDTLDDDSLSERPLLRYPLEPGTEWILWEDPMTVAVVEELELLELPAGTFPAFRIRIEAPVLGENGWAFVWYGECGRVKSDQHIEIMAMDALTGEIAIIIQERRDALADLTVASSSACTQGKKKEGGRR